MTEGEAGQLRIDKWLFFVRFYKTRVLAGRAVSGGHVKLNGARSKPSAAVRPGDIVDIVRDQLPWRVEVAAIPGRRGPAAEARACYREDPAIAEMRSALASGRRMDRLQMPMTDGRPDKRTRRKLRDRRRG